MAISNHSSILGKRRRNDSSQQSNILPPPKRACKTADIIFHSLPPEIMLEIFRRFNFVELGIVARVCRRWRDIAYDAHACTTIDIDIVTPAQRNLLASNAGLSSMISRWNHLNVLRISRGTGISFGGIASVLIATSATLQDLSLPRIEVDFSDARIAATAHTAFRSLRRLRSVELRGSLASAVVLSALAEGCYSTLTRLHLSGLEWNRNDMQCISAFVELQELSLKHSSDELFDPTVLIPLTKLRILSLHHALGDLPLAIDDPISRQSEAQLIHGLQHALMQHSDTLEMLTISDHIEFDRSWADSLNAMRTLKCLTLRSFCYDASFWDALRVVGGQHVVGSSLQRVRLEFEYAKDLLEFVQRHAARATSSLEANANPATPPVGPVVEAVYVANEEEEENDENDKCEEDIIHGSEIRLVPVANTDVIALASTSSASPIQLLRELIRRNAAALMSASNTAQAEPIELLG